MRLIPGGVFAMGSDEEFAWPEERPAHKVRVSRFFLDETEVTNARFSEFVRATGYLTTAERRPDAEAIRAQAAAVGGEVPAQMLEPGGMVFRPTPGPVNRRDLAQWWFWVPGAQWRHPQGPESSIERRADHPVVMVSWDDAKAFCTWAGKRLPTEAEWERAARGGLEGQPYVWGSTQPNDDKSLFANIWQGSFPWKNTIADGFEGTAPVRSFKPNGYGLYDMAGNVWEWTADWYDPRSYPKRAGAVTENPPGSPAPVDREGQRAQRGGSFLCHASYCSRYRPSARHGADADIPASHSGIRCARSDGSN
jgi:formylglycine-generating enzyme